MWRILRRKAHSRLREDLRSKCSPSDLVQEAMLDATRDFDEFRGASRGEFLAWLVRILENKLADLDHRFRHCQKRQLGREVPLDDSRLAAKVPNQLVDPQPSPGSVVCRVEEHQKLQAMLGCLPARYRRVICLRFEQDLPFEEIGTRLGCSKEVARKLCTRAVRRLAGCYA